MNDMNDMSEDEADDALSVCKQYQDCIIAIGAVLLAPLTPEQTQYVIDKMNDEFRFWRVMDAVEDAR